MLTTGITKIGNGITVNFKGKYFGFPKVISELSRLGYNITVDNKESIFSTCGTISINIDSQEQPLSVRRTFFKQPTIFGTYHIPDGAPDEVKETVRIINEQGIRLVYNFTRDINLLGNSWGRK